MDINKTSVIKDPIAGSGLAASQDIGIGDIIIQLSSPYLLVVEKEAIHKVCSFCLIEASPLPDAPPLKRCSACKVPRYCSSECHKKDWLAGHLKECPILTSLRDIPPTPVRALIQLLLQHQHGASLNPRWAALESHVEDFKMDRKRWDDILLQAQGAVGFSRSPQDRMELAIQVLCRMMTNAFRATLADDTPVGLCFEPILALANHSCSPNAVVVFDGRSVALRALEQIGKGEQVFISYITATEDRTSRQTNLKQRYFFDCQCEKCSKDESPYSTFLRYAPKAEGRVDLLCNSEYMTRNAENLVSRYERTKDGGGCPIDFTKATSYLQQSQTVNTYPGAKTPVFKKAAYACEPDRKEFALHPAPKIMHEMYLNYLDGHDWLDALAILLFLFLECDVYNYPQPHHPVRVIRLISIARLLKEISTLSPLAIKASAGDVKLQPKLHRAIEEFDWINSVHAIMILVAEQAPKSHGRDSILMRRVEAELRCVEEAKRLRREVGERLREWMTDANSAEGTKEAQTIMEALRKLSECVWELMATIP